MSEDCGVRVEIDPTTKTVLLTFEGMQPPDEGQPSGVEVTLSPELARDLAFTLTRASYIVEGDEDL